jgi:hypothetical protein
VEAAAGKMAGKVETGEEGAAEVEIAAVTEEEEVVEVAVEDVAEDVVAVVVAAVLPERLSMRCAK